MTVVREWDLDATWRCKLVVWLLMILDRCDDGLLEKPKLVA